MPRLEPNSKIVDEISDFTNHDPVGCQKAVLIRDIRQLRLGQQRFASSEEDRWALGSGLSVMIFPAKPEHYTRPGLRRSRSGIK